MTQPRRSIPNAIVNRVLIECRRRCCLCFFWNRDAAQKQGQIAHIDRSRHNNAESNLAYLCFDHHNEYDSQQSQGRSITVGELRNAKQQLLSRLDSGEHSRVLVSVEVDGEFDSFTDADEAAIGRLIRVALQSHHEIIVRSRSRGSILLEIELDTADAIHLSEMIDAEDPQLKQLRSVIIRELVDSVGAPDWPKIVAAAALEFARQSLSEVERTTEFKEMLQRMTIGQMHALWQLDRSHMTQEQVQAVRQEAAKRLAYLKSNEIENEALRDLIDD